MKKKISKTVLETMIKESIKKKLLESNNFTALRQLKHQAVSTSMAFESNIQSELNLMDPDQLSPDLQKKYYEIVDQLKDNIVNSVLNTSKLLASFPKNETASKKTS